MEDDNNLSNEISLYEKNLLQFQNYIINNINDIQKIKNELINLSLDGKAESELMISFSLKIYLKSLSINKDTSLKKWLEETLSQRNAYKEKLKINNSKGNQLGEGENSERSGCNNFFVNAEIKQLIDSDINNSFHDKDLFRESSIKEIEYNILCLFAENNKPILYKQGMINILAILIFNLHPYYVKSDNKDYNNELFDKWVNEPTNYIKDIYNFFHDEDEFQSDLYYLMDNIMKFGVNKFFEENNDQNLSKKCRDISELIKIQNNKLYLHFLKNKVDYEVILRKWIKSLFTKQIEIKDCGVILDMILADETKNSNGDFLYINYFCVAIIELISDELLNLEDNECFSKLSNYPPLENIRTLLPLVNKIKSNINNKTLNENNNENKKDPVTKVSPISMADFLFSSKNKSGKTPNLMFGTGKTPTPNSNLMFGTGKTHTPNLMFGTGKPQTQTPNLMFGGDYSNNKKNISSISKTNHANQPTIQKKVPMFGNINKNEQSKKDNNLAKKFDFVNTKSYHVSNEENIKQLNELKGLIDYYVKVFSDEDKMKIDYLIDQLSQEL